VLTNSVASQGVDYAAGIATNLLPDNADPVGVANMKNLFSQAATNCPNSVVVAGGYSQGAAITHEAIKGLPSATKNQIVGVALFGDTRNKQDHGQIDGYPQDDLLIICNPGDLVCDGTLIITPAHLGYAPRVPEAVAFLSQKTNAAAIT
jgi:cutinase